MTMLPKPKKTKYIKIQKGNISIFVSKQKSKAYTNTNSFVFYVKENGYLIDKHFDIGKKLLKNLLDKKGLELILHTL
jgi:hypothetical protein